MLVSCHFTRELLPNADNMLNSSIIYKLSED